MHTCASYSCKITSAQIAVFSDKAHEMIDIDAYMFLTLAASKTKKEREESLNWGGGGGGELAKCICNSLLKSLSWWGQTCSCVTHF